MFKLNHKYYFFNNGRSLLETFWLHLFALAYFWWCWGKLSHISTKAVFTSSRFQTDLSHLLQIPDMLYWIMYKEHACQFIVGSCTLFKYTVTERASCGRALSYTRRKFAQIYGVKGTTLSCRTSCIYLYMPSTHCHQLPSILCVPLNIYHPIT